MSDSRSNFVRQSAWLAAATLAGGMLMTLGHPIAANMPGGDYGVWGAMLRVFLLLGIPTAGVQTVFAERSAAAITPERQRELSSAFRGAFWAAFGFWCVLSLCVIGGQARITAALNLKEVSVLWPTLLSALCWLVLPLFKGVLQGRQHFGALGWVAVLDGIGRLSLLVVVVLVLRLGATAGMWAVVLGQAVSLAAAGVATREVWSGAGGRVSWGEWLRRGAPFTIGSAGMVVLANFDYPFFQSVVPPAEAEELKHLYFPAMMIGFALTQVTVPLAMVLFPKIVRSAATGAKSDALLMAVIGTATVGGVAACATMVLPALPLRILYFNKPENWVAAPLVPWFVWAMLAYALANVLVNNLLARARFAIVGWVAFVAVGYVAALWLQKPAILAAEPMAASRRVALTVGLANLVLFAGAFAIPRDGGSAAKPG